MAFRIDTRDILFTVKEYLGLDKILGIPAYSELSEEMFDMVLEEAVKFSTDVLEPVNLKTDGKGCRLENNQVYLPEEFVKIYKDYCEADWMGMSADPEFGGQGMPYLFSTVCGETFLQSCTSFTFTPALTRGAAGLIHAFGADWMKKVYLENMYSGKWAGTMCLTEPGAGSAVGDLKSVAKPFGDHYKVSGTKLFITSGDHNLTENIIHMVLARVEGATAGIKGVSLFLVPKYRVNDDGSVGEFNDINVGGIEHKMGIHASATALLNFGENDGCVGYLIGEVNRGIQYMFQMMNEARIGVGLQGMALGAAAYQVALDYSKERVQGTDIRAFKDPNAPRVAIIEHPDVRRMLMTMKAYTEGTRALLYKSAWYADFAEHGEAGEEKDKAQNMLDLLTPVCKAYGSDMGFQTTALGVQVLGGYGYIAEYKIEQHLRDVKIASIYEGTNGIQAMDLLGRKLGLKGGMVFMTYMMDINAFVEANASHPVLAKQVARFQEIKDIMGETAMNFGMQSMSDPLYPISHATPFLEMFGDVTCAWLLLEQGVLAQDKLNAILESKGANTDEARTKAILENDDARFYFNKVKTAQFFVDQVLPRVKARVESIKSEDRSLLEAAL